jgi:hypothetical protein
MMGKTCISRRTALLGLGALPMVRQLVSAAQTVSKADASKFTMPGPFRGRVAAIHHPRSISAGKYQAGPVREMIRRGMTELTGASDWREAWRYFFQPGDVVGLKLNPVGLPHIISAPEVVGEIIFGLQEAGIPARDIIVYDRYRAQFAKAGFAKWIPQGVRTGSSSEDWDEVQQAIEGYDPNHYMDMALTLPGQDPSSPRARRSYASTFIARDVNKLINLALLKEHQSAGVTLALKNLSHGLVNNVNRSHPTFTLNACGVFIPAVVAMPVIRNKAVLHILDGVHGQYNGGPSGRPQFIWEHKTMYFATDPVAMDRIGWQEIDKKRLAEGMQPVAVDKPDEFSRFIRRQPEHVEIAGALGLGEFDDKKIDVRRAHLG